MAGININPVETARAPKENQVADLAPAFLPIP
jgi:hypothetical protein